MKKIVSLLVLTILLTSCTLNLAMDNVSTTEAKTIVQTFITENLLPASGKLEVWEVKSESWLFALDLTIENQWQEQKITWYLTKDGKNFIAEMMNIDEVKKKVAEQKIAEEKSKEAELKDLVKSEKPKVELFIMSHCPYGTQMEKGMLPVADTLGDKIDFEIKFVDYAMHAQKEIDEQVNQYCVKKEMWQTTLNTYLKCFLENETYSEKCLTEINIDKTKHKVCKQETEAKYKMSENFANKKEMRGQFPSFKIDAEDNTKYWVQGSPTLVINGKIMSSWRDPASVLKTVCSAFTEAPEECNTELPSASPSAWFWFGAAWENYEASCEV